MMRKHVRFASNLPVCKDKEEPATFKILVGRKATCPPRVASSQL